MRSKIRENTTKKLIVKKIDRHIPKNPKKELEHPQVQR
jgi:hypothetical protein